MRDGLNVAIVGTPNVGKSSLMNYLLNEDRAIVTDVAGTTRDVLKEWISIGGIPVNLIDTAGIRNTEDLVEQIGVERSKEVFNNADLIITVLAANNKLSVDEKELLSLACKKKSIVLINKCDLDKKIDIEEIRSFAKKSEICEISIKNCEGLSKIEEIFLRLASDGALTKKGGDFILNQRQLSSLVRSMQNIKLAVNSLDEGMPLDLIEVDLINAYDALGEISGKTVDEDVINRIFEKFCLGK